jgi:hypothetical protein
MPATSQKRRLRRWSLQARFDVPTFVHVLRCGALFISAISRVWPIHVARVWPPRKRDFRKSQAGLRDDDAITSFM